MDNLKGLIDQTKFESILPNDHIQTGVIDSGISILFNHYGVYSPPETLKPLFKKRYFWRTHNYSYWNDYL